MLSVAPMLHKSDIPCLLVNKFASRAPTQRKRLLLIACRVVNAFARCPSINIGIFQRIDKDKSTEKR